VLAAYAAQERISTRELDGVLLWPWYWDLQSVVPATVTRPRCTEVDSLWGVLAQTLPLEVWTNPIVAMFGRGFALIEVAAGNGAPCGHVVHH
jgi:hypothetical protein